MMKYKCPECEGTFPEIRVDHEVHYTPLPHGVIPWELEIKLYENADRTIQFSHNGTSHKPVSRVYNPERYQELVRYWN